MIQTLPAVQCALLVTVEAMRSAGFRTWPAAAGMQILAAGMAGPYGERRPFAPPARQTGWQAPW